MMYRAAPTGTHQNLNAFNREEITVPRFLPSPLPFSVITPTFSFTVLLILPNMPFIFHTLVIWCFVNQPGV